MSWYDTALVCVNGDVVNCLHGIIPFMMTDITGEVVRRVVGAYSRDNKGEFFCAGCLTSGSSAHPSGFTTGAPS